jgi:hypothetical protein
VCIAVQCLGLEKHHAVAASMATQNTTTSTHELRRLITFLTEKTNLSR